MGFLEWLDSEEEVPCQDTPLELWFEPYCCANLYKAQNICEGCHLKQDCLTHARKNLESGIWGGSVFEFGKELKFICHQCKKYYN